MNRDIICTFINHDIICIIINYNIIICIIICIIINQHCHIYVQLSTIFCRNKHQQQQVPHLKSIVNVVIYQQPSAISIYQQYKKCQPYQYISNILPHRCSIINVKKKGQQLTEAAAAIRVPVTVFQPNAMADHEIK